jgi:hypothetical protein
MKFKKMMVAVAAQMLLVGGAYAQTCTPTAGTMTDSFGTVNVNTCSSTNQLLSSCSGLNAIGASPDTIYQVQIGAGATGNISIAPTGYDATLALMSGSCSAGSFCARESEAGAIGVTETVQLSGLTAGPYWVLITSFGGAPDCGPTAVTVTPLLPVTLQNFSVN